MTSAMIKKTMALFFTICGNMAACLHFVLCMLVTSGHIVELSDGTRQNTGEKEASHEEINLYVLFSHLYPIHHFTSGCIS